jgi:hypothetical protein
MRISLILSVLVSIVALSGCAGMRHSGNQITVHAESFNILGLEIPGDDYVAAKAMVPADATIHTVASSPHDWTSFFGALNRIIGISWTQITATKNK